MPPNTTWNRGMQSCSFLMLLVEQTKLDNRTLQDCGVCLEAACAKQVLFSLCARLRVVYWAQMARIVAQIPAAGWAWRDCKPVNWALQSLARDRRPQANLAAAFKREILRFIKAIQRLRSSLA